MRYRIDFPAEPNTTYVIHAECDQDALLEAYELGRRMQRKEWTVQSDGAGTSAMNIRYDNAPTTQIVKVA